MYLLYGIYCIIIVYCVLFYVHDIHWMIAMCYKVYSNYVWFEGVPVYIQLQSLSHFVCFKTSTHSNTHTHTHTHSYSCLSFAPSYNIT